MSEDRHERGVDERTGHESRLVISDSWSSDHVELGDIEDDENRTVDNGETAGIDERTGDENGLAIGDTWSGGGAGLGGCAGRLGVDGVTGSRVFWWGCGVGWRLVRQLGEPPEHAETDDPRK